MNAIQILKRKKIPQVMFASIFCCNQISERVRQKVLFKINVLVSCKYFASPSPNYLVAMAKSFFNQSE